MSAMQKDRERFQGTLDQLFLRRHYLFSKQLNGCQGMVFRAWVHKQVRNGWYSHTSHINVTGFAKTRHSSARTEIHFIA